MAAFTFTTLKQTIQDYLESDETTLVADLPIMIRQAEDRILTNAQMPNFRKNSALAMTSSSEYLTIPSDFLTSYSLSIDNTGYEFLLFKEVNFIREAYPLSTVEAAPRYYAIYDDTQFIVAPTPDANYAVELHYFYRPESITEAASGTSWLGTNAEATLLYACLLEVYIFQKGDGDMMAKYEERYESALAKLKLLGEGFNKTDAYRSG